MKVSTRYLIGRFVSLHCDVKDADHGCPSLPYRLADGLGEPRLLFQLFDVEREAVCEATDFVCFDALARYFLYHCLLRMASWLDAMCCLSTTAKPPSLSVFRAARFVSFMNLKAHFTKGSMFEKSRRL